jgi:hypothetical protein
LLEISLNNKAIAHRGVTLQESGVIVFILLFLNKAGATCLEGMGLINGGGGM